VQPSHGVDRLGPLFASLFDESRFLSPYGLRSLSAIHRDQPYVLHLEGTTATIDYEPAESTTGRPLSASHSEDTCTEASRSTSVCTGSPAFSPAPPPGVDGDVATARRDRNAAGEGPAARRVRRRNECGTSAARVSSGDLRDRFLSPPRKNSTRLGCTL